MGALIKNLEEDILFNLDKFRNKVEYDYSDRVWILGLVAERVAYAMHIKRNGEYSKGSTFEKNVDRLSNNKHITTKIKDCFDLVRRNSNYVRHSVYRPNNKRLIKVVRATEQILSYYKVEFDSSVVFSEKLLDVLGSHDRTELQESEEMDVLDLFLSEYNEEEVIADSKLMYSVTNRSLDFYFIYSSQIYDFWDYDSEDEIKKIYLGNISIDELKSLFTTHKEELVTNLYDFLEGTSKYCLDKRFRFVKGNIEFKLANVYYFFDGVNSAGAKHIFNEFSFDVFWDIDCFKDPRNLEIVIYDEAEFLTEDTFYIEERIKLTDLDELFANEEISDEIAWVLFINEKLKIHGVLFTGTCFTINHLQIRPLNILTKELSINFGKPCVFRLEFPYKLCCIIIDSWEAVTFSHDTGDRYWPEGFHHFYCRKYELDIRSFISFLYGGSEDLNEFIRDVPYRKEDYTTYEERNQDLNDALNEYKKRTPH